MPRTRSQIIAEQAYRQVSAQIGREFTKEYGRLCHRFPVLVMENGLAQTLGFLTGKAAGSRAEEVFLDHIAEALGQQRKDVLTAVLRAELNDYLRFTRQAMAAAIWYKRFAQGVLGVDATGENQDEDGEDG